MEDEKNSEIYIPPKNLIITPSGMRGEVGSVLTIEAIIRFTKSFGLWLGKGSTILIGRDTRSTGKMITSAAIAAINSVGVNVIDAGITPTPAVLYYIRKYNLDGAMIVSGSHNPPKDNGIKYLSRTHTFLGKDELAEINKYFIYGGKLNDELWRTVGSYEKKDITREYMDALKKHLNQDLLSKSKLKVVVDPDAGAGVNVTDVILSEMGCDTSVINNEFINYPDYPRPIEPVKAHLSDLSKSVVKLSADIGFAHDCDADRVAIVGHDGTVYPEDITLVLLLKYILERYFEDEKEKKRAIIVTNSASSLLFEKMAEPYNCKVVRTPVGERYLAMKMNELIEKNPETLVFGGEGSSGGFMFPEFNNARDGIFASCIMCELLAYYGRTAEELISELPEFFRTREIIRLGDKTVKEIMDELKKKLDLMEIEYSIIDRDVKITRSEKEEWILVHPSNTEPVLRIITESPNSSRTDEICTWMSEIIKDFL